jgi:hypothetical protein
MEELSEGKEICPMGEGSILQKLGKVRLQSTDAATNAVDTAMPRTEQIPHGLEAGFKQVILLTGKPVQPLPTAEPEVRRDHQQPGETGAKGCPTIQGKGHPGSEEGLRVITESLRQAATDLSPLLPGAAESLPEVLPELHLWVTIDPLVLPPGRALAGLLLLLPRVAEALTEALLGVLQEVAVVVVLAATSKCIQADQHHDKQIWWHYSYALVEWCWPLRHKIIDI